ncbi:hypothetical protein E6O75_ATG05956 [Venturia nashicola]|uniref:Uncharacterized protein n=1 Tax=Venturia nashicola TaxID=86259 RepID=A0A4Z1P3S1_9PEZI|nr:hypothetical protein E6O75_ATG05956 [Venturia nashicola]
MHLPNVLAGLQHDVMHCKRRYAHLINDAALEAISYCWARQQATIPITQYLDTAMKAFQRSNMRVLFWALRQSRVSEGDEFGRPKFLALRLS